MGREWIREREGWFGNWVEGTVGLFEVGLLDIVVIAFW